MEDCAALRHVAVLVAPRYRLSCKNAYRSTKAAGFGGTIYSDVRRHGHERQRVPPWNGALPETSARNEMRELRQGQRRRALAIASIAAPSSRCRRRLPVAAAAMATRPRSPVPQAANASQADVAQDGGRTASRATRHQPDAWRARHSVACVSRRQRSVRFSRPAARVRSVVRSTAGDARGDSCLRIAPEAAAGLPRVLIAACVVVALLAFVGSGKCASDEPAMPVVADGDRGPSVMSTFPPEATPQRTPRQPDAAAGFVAAKTIATRVRRDRGDRRPWRSSRCRRSPRASLPFPLPAAEERPVRSAGGRRRSRAGAGSARTVAARSAEGPGGRPVDADERRAFAVHARGFHFTRRLRPARALALLQRLLGQGRRSVRAIRPRTPVVPRRQVNQWSRRIA